MKRIALFLVMIICVGTLSAQNLFKAKTDKVTMYFGQALVEKSVRVDLQKGDNVLLLDGNSSYLQDNTVQFAVSEDFMLTDYNVVMVSSENLSSYEENLPEKERRQYKKLCDTITILKELLREKESYIEKRIRHIVGFEGDEPTANRRFVARNQIHIGLLPQENA